jgi:hypothetical protein
VSEFQTTAFATTQAAPLRSSFRKAITHQGEHLSDSHFHSLSFTLLALLSFVRFPLPRLCALTVLERLWGNVVNFFPLSQAHLKRTVAVGGSG